MAKRTFNKGDLVWVNTEPFGALFTYRIEDFTPNGEAILYSKNDWTGEWRLHTVVRLKNLRKKD